MVWHPEKYAQLLAAKVSRHKTRVWLVNTGWSGGAYGVGSRISLSHTRAIMNAIHNGQLANAQTSRNTLFGFDVVTECPGVPRELLIPRDKWQDKKSYDATAKKLFQLFEDNFKRYKGVLSTVAESPVAA